MNRKQYARNAWHQSWIVGVLVVMSLGLQVEETLGLTPHFVGCIGNSGTHERPVLMGPYEAGDVTRSQTQAGPVYIPETGILYATAGAERLNAYRINGELVASYGIPKGFFNTLSPCLIRAGDALYFVRHFGWARPGSLWKLPIGAPDGSTAERVDLPIKSIGLISKRVYQDELAIVSASPEYKLYFWNIKTGVLRESGNLQQVKPFVIAMDWNSKGELFAISYDKIYKLADGQLQEGTGYPKTYIGQRMVSPRNCFFLDGALWGVAGSTLLRFNEATFEPDPGVAFSGRGRPTLSYIFYDNDIGDAGGIASLGNSYYAVTGRLGSIILFHWDEETRTCERVRRIGSIPEHGSFVLSRDGVILVGDVGYLWDDSETAVTHTSWLYPAEYSTRLGEDAVRFSAPWRGRPHSFVAFGPFRECQSNRNGSSDHGRLADFTKLVGAATKGDSEVYTLNSDGVAGRFIIRAKQPFSLTWEGDVALKFRAPIKGEFSSFETVSDTVSVLACGGHVILMQPEGAELREVRRFPWNFEPGCLLSGDGQWVVVSEKQKNLVTIFSLEGTALARISVEAPGRVSLCGTRLIVHDTKNQRILKYELRN